MILCVTNQATRVKKSFIFPTLFSYNYVRREINWSLDFIIVFLLLNMDN